MHGGIFHRHQMMQGCFGDHETTHMLGQVTGEAQDFADQPDQQLYLGRVRVEAVLPQVALQGLLFIPPGPGLGEQLYLVGGKAQGLAHIAHRRARPVADHGGRQRRAFAPVLAVDVLDDFLAALVLEIHVYVRRFLARAADEAREQQVALLGVDLGDLQRIADRRIGGGATALALDADTAGVAHDVVHGQKIVFELQLGDQRQFLLQGFFTLGATPRGQRRAAPSSVRRRSWSIALRPRGTSVCGYW